MEFSGTSRRMFKLPVRGGGGGVFLGSLWLFKLYANSIAVAFRGFVDLY